MKFHFDRRLALAAGLASAGSGIGTIGLTKLLGWTVGYGLAPAFLSLAVAFLPGLVVSFFLVRPSSFLVDSPDPPSLLADQLRHYISLLTSLPFITYLLGRLLLIGSSGAFFAFAADEAQHAFGLTKEEANNVIAISGAANLAGRVNFY